MLLLYVLVVHVAHVSLACWAKLFLDQSTDERGKDKRTRARLNRHARCSELMENFCDDEQLRSLIVQTVIDTTDQNMFTIAWAIHDRVGCMHGTRE
jgi:hypothetical protein